MAGNTVALVNMGAVATNITILDSGEVVFSRDIPIGGSSYTHDLATALGVNTDEAESIKLGMSAGETPDEAVRSVKTTHAIVTEEIKSTFEFFQNTTKTKGINRAFITGGGSKVPGLAAQLGQVVPCEVMNPFLRLKVDSSRFPVAYLKEVKDLAAIAIGLGLRDAE
jgi:type IV pilus assembly protein PilM